MTFELKLFPHILTRLSGGPFKELENLNLKNTAKIIDDINAINQEIKNIRNKISDELYKLIPSKEDKTVQNILLGFKRDIFNNRAISPQQLELAIPHLPEELKQEAARYFELKEKSGQLYLDIEKNYQEEILKSRRALAELVQNVNLQKGLLLSSQSLLNGIKNYLEKDPQAFRKKEVQTEQSLMKYITRMYAKTSPFSTFTNLAFGKPVEDAKTGAPFLQTKEDKEGQPEVISHIRLNNMVYQYMKGILLKNKDIYEHFLLRPNPTIKNNTDHYLFLINSNNLESFQRIPANPVIELFLELLVEKKEGLVYRELIKKIIDGEYIEASEEELQSYIGQLIEYGFLEYNIGVSGIDPDWDLKLQEKLKTFAGDLPLIKELIASLQAVREYANQYGGEDLQKRKDILQKAFDELRRICMKLHEAAGLPADERKTVEEIRKEWEKKQKEFKAEAEKKAIDKKEEAEKKEEAAPKEEETKKEEGEKNEEKDKEEEKDIVFKQQTSTYFHFKPEQIFYEDTSIAVTPLLKQDELTNFTVVVNGLLQEMRLFEGHQHERIKMQHFFDKHYGDNKEIDLLTFYEEFYREFKKPEAEYQELTKKMSREKLKQAQPQKDSAKETKEDIEKKPGNQPASIPSEEDIKKESELKKKLEVPEIEKVQQQQKQWLEIFQKQFENRKTNGKVELSFAEIKKTNDEYGLLSPSLISPKGRRGLHVIAPSLREGRDGLSKNSFGAFVQFFLEKDKEGKQKLMGVLNAPVPGYGKMFSRFLHIFENDITDTLRQWNKSLAGEAMYAEDCDASYFNANLHPPLMPYEVWMPNGHNSLSPEQQIPITDMAVVKDEKNNTLKLIHKSSRKEVYIFDIGFQGGMGRSQLFQLLERFTLAEFLSWHSLLGKINYKDAVDENTKEKVLEKGAEKEARKVMQLPRIEYEGQLILQRKTWHIPKPVLPAKQTAESDCAYFIRVNEWRTNYGMPDEVFVFVVANRHELEYINPELRKKIGRDDYKPQYISFRNPFLVTLFEKLITKVPGVMRIEEMLPNSQQLLEIKGNKHITEFVIQWYNQDKN